MQKIYIIALLFVLTFSIYPQDKITNYKLLTSAVKEYERADFEIVLSSGFSNPYDQKEIALDMILSSPSGKAISLPCFYVSGDNSSSSWRARFTPQELGGYKYYFKLSKYTRSAAVTQTDSFSVVQSGKNGFLHKNDLWTFKFDSGNLFRGIGENVGWESRSWENPKWTYDYLLSTLSKNGANFFRTWMCPWNLAVEWKQVKDTKRYTSSDSYFNPSGLKRMDALISMAESQNLYIMLTLDWHGAFITDDGWSLSNYNYLNGGPARNPTEFFTLDAAKDKYKNRLRYLVARWGYSTSIGAWEFFNEIDNSAYTSSNVVRIPLDAVSKWHDEMSTYLKSIDPYGHLVTTSVSHRDIPGMNSLQNLDFNQKHIYKNTAAVPSTIRSYVSSTGKPYVIGEFGFRYEDADPQYSTDFNYDYKRGLWYGLFTSTPILPMTWWWELFDDNKMTPYFRSVRSISDQMLKAGNGSFQPVSVSASNLETYGMKCGKQYFVFVLNGSSGNVNVNPSFNVTENGTYYLRSLAPADFKYTDLPEMEVTNNKVTVPAVSIPGREGVLLVISTEPFPPAIPPVEIPADYTLEQNYPNPFNPGTTISYSLPEDSQVKISVYDILGREVETVTDEVQSAGKKEIRFNAYNLSSGIYFYSISAKSVQSDNSFSKVKKMIIVK